MVVYLVSNGADPHQRNRRGELPIDYAYRLKFYGVVGYLAANHPYVNTNSICSYPEGLLDYIFSVGVFPDDSVVYVSVNGEEPPPHLLDWVRTRLPGATPYGFDRSKGTVVEGGITYHGSEWGEHLKEKYPDTNVVQFNIRVCKGWWGRKWSFTIGCHMAPLTGWFLNGEYRYVRKYKHWIVIEKGGGTI